MILDSFKSSARIDASQDLARARVGLESGIRSCSNEAAAGLMMSRVAKSSLSMFFGRLETSLDSDAREVLIDAAEQTVKKLNLPSEVLEGNWTVNPFGQARLLAKFRELIAEGRSQELLPLHPSGDVFDNYVQVFARINNTLTSG